MADDECVYICPDDCEFLVEQKAKDQKQWLCRKFGRFLSRSLANTPIRLDICIPHVNFNYKDIE